MNEVKERRRIQSAIAAAQGLALRAASRAERGHFNRVEDRWRAKLKMMETGEYDGRTDRPFADDAP